VRKHQQWSVFWDPQYHLWRAAEDDPEGSLRGCLRSRARSAMPQAQADRQEPVLRGTPV